MRLILYDWVLSIFTRVWCNSCLPRMLWAVPGNLILRQAYVVVKWAHFWKLKIWGNWTNQEWGVFRSLKQLDILGIWLFMMSATKLAWQRRWSYEQEKRIMIMIMYDNAPHSYLVINTSDYTQPLPCTLLRTTVSKCCMQSKAGAFFQKTIKNSTELHLIALQVQNSSLININPNHYISHHSNICLMTHLFNKIAGYMCFNDLLSYT